MALYKGKKMALYKAEGFIELLSKKNYGQKHIILLCYQNNIIKKFI